MQVVGDGAGRGWDLRDEAVSRDHRDALGFAVGAVIAHIARDAWVDARRFDPAQFRAAADRGDLEALEDEAYAAAKQQTLLGRSRDRVRASLGPPDRVGHRSRTYIWDLGMINDAIGPRDQGAFRVRFDGTWHVVGAEVS